MEGHFIDNKPTRKLFKTPYPYSFILLSIHNFNMIQHINYLLWVYSFISPFPLLFHCTCFVNKIVYFVKWINKKYKNNFIYKNTLTKNINHQINFLKLTVLYWTHCECLYCRLPPSSSDSCELSMYSSNSVAELRETIYISNEEKASNKLNILWTLYAITFNNLLF